MGRGSRGECSGIFEENVVRRVVAELEIHLFLRPILEAIQIGIEHAVSEAVRAGGGAVRCGGGGQFVYVDETAHEMAPIIDFQHAIGAGPVLHGSAKPVLGFLGTP